MNWKKNMDNWVDCMSPSLTLLLLWSIPMVFGSSCCDERLPWTCKVLSMIACLSSPSFLSWKANGLEQWRTGNSTALTSHVASLVQLILKSGWKRLVTGNQGEKRTRNWKNKGKRRLFLARDSLLTSWKSISPVIEFPFVGEKTFKNCHVFVDILLCRQVKRYELPKMENQGKPQRIRTSFLIVSETLSVVTVRVKNIFHKERLSCLLNSNKEKTKWLSDGLSLSLCNNFWKLENDWKVNETN
jgi:hypothetical protein